MSSEDCVFNELSVVVLPVLRFFFFFLLLLP